MVSVPKTEKTMIQCICNACPSYTECMTEGKIGVFCSIGDELRCFESTKGCNCEECSVPMEYSFSSTYHCKDGTAEMQNK